MKEQVLSASDRAALQSLIPLAGALGAGTVFGLFFAGRRRAGFAMFEIFTMVAILAAVGTTAYFCIALLHQDQAISDSDLARTATPLIVAAFLLVFVNVFSRLPGSTSRVVALLPLAIGAAVVAVELSTSTWTARPEDASLLALAILVIGALLGVVGWWSERLEARWERIVFLRRLERLGREGYEPAAARLGLVVPGDGAEEPLRCWRRKGRVYLDAEAGERLRDLAEDRWRALSAAEPASAEPTLLRLRLGPSLGRGRTLRVETFAAGERRERDLPENEDRLFDVTELGLLEPAAG